MLATIDAQDKLDKVILDYSVLDMRFKELQGNTKKKGRAIVVQGAENDLYNGEAADAVLDVVKAYLANEKANSRKQHLLLDIMKHNEIDGTKTSYLETIKSIFSSYSGITPKIKSELKKLDMEIVEDGAHNHVKFIGDERYKVSFAKTPSDKGRVGDNIVRDIKAQLF